MRLVLLLSFPVLVLCFAVLVTILLNWSQGVPLCATWMARFIPVCG